MKISSLLLTLAMVLAGPWAARAQDLAGSAGSLRGVLRDMAGAVERKFDKDEGKEIGRSIDKAREDLDKVQERAKSYAPRESIGEPLVKAREHVREALRKLEDRHAGDTLRRLSDDARRGLAEVEAAWAGYGDQRPPPPPRGGGGYYPRSPEPESRGALTDERAQIFATRELASNLRVSPDSVSITRMERSGGRYRAYGSVRGAGRYVVDLDAISGRVYSVNPLR